MFGFSAWKDWLEINRYRTGMYDQYIFKMLNKDMPEERNTMKSRHHKVTAFNETTVFKDESHFTYKRFYVWNINLLKWIKNASKRPHKYFSCD